ncbi:DUF6344 domain-containing protein [Streptomyces aurantiacus]|uniref:DUF6344 domain-containing protein n=1 Tax=Streptomyces aurantiacus TaxID=47760 RepID=UPI0007C6C300
MTRNPVMNLWTALVTAVLALLTSLGLITTTAVAAVPEAETARNTNAPQDATAQEEPIRALPYAQPYAHSLPPTMKQRIHAEAHGSSPSCRHRPPTDTAATDTTVPHPALPHDSAPAPAAARTTTDTVTAPTGPTDPSGTTHMTTGVMDIGRTEGIEGGPGTELGGELRTRTPAVACAPTAPAMDAAPVTAVVLPSQAAAPVRLPAPATAPVLATAGAAIPG